MKLLHIGFDLSDDFLGRATLPIFSARPGAPKSRGEDWDLRGSPSDREKARANR